MVVMTTISDHPGTKDQPPGNKVTLKQVADLAGCSEASASKALLGRSDISDELRTAVEQAAATLGYRRRKRKGIPTAQRQSITLSFDTFGSLYSSELLAGMLPAARKEGFETNVAILPSKTEDAGILAGWIDKQIAAGHRGSVMVTSASPPNIGKISRDLDFPLITIDPRHPIYDGVTSVGSTNWAGSAEATGHLISLGHRRIAYAGYFPESSFAWERFNGYQSALEAADIPLDRRLIFEGETDYADGLKIGEKIAAMHPSRRPTAVVCLCDALAFGVIEATRQNGIATPDDLSVIGFDDVLPSRWFSPPLTTIRQPIRRMGALAVRTLIRVLGGGEPDSHYVQLATSLVIRKSTSPYVGPDSAPKDEAAEGGPH